MFYSQSILALKGRLSTVWIAAHLQHRLKKSQYASTHIPTTVEHIMDPAVPIALRMSAHLLLGVVRIYSKKVDYLLNDCNAARTHLYKVFPSVLNHTLPEDAGQAPVHSITLPATFDLDLLTVDYEIDTDGYEDVHTRSQEEITLPDQIPIVPNNYVTICFDEDETFGYSNAQLRPDSEATPMEEVIISQSPSTNVEDVQDCGPSFRRESHTTNHSGDDNLRIFQDPIIKETMPVEELRNPSNDNDTIGNLPDLGFNETEPNMDFNQTVNEKDQTVETSPTQPAGPQTPVSTQDGASDAQVCGGQDSRPTFECGSVEFRPLPTPQMDQGRQDQVQDQRHPRGRKRKQFFDDPIVLPNSFMRETLNDTRKILRKRKDVTTYTFDSWELKCKRLKEDIFDQPLFTGTCKELINIHKREYIHSKPHLVISEENHLDNATSTSPINQVVDEPITDAPEIIVNASGVEEIEQICSVVNAPPPTIPTHSIDTEPIIEGTYESPVRGATPTSVSETVEIPYGATSPRAHASEIGTPSTYQDTILHNYDIPDTNQCEHKKCVKPTFVEFTLDLWFLVPENNTPATTSSQSTSKSISTLSERTRGLAQYLKDYSPCTTIPEHPAEDFSLNKILDGKTRKMAARMFFEVLVLKTHDLIDGVKQEEPYGDVSFKLTPTLSKAKI